MVRMEIRDVVSSNLIKARGEMPRKKLAELSGLTYQHIYEIEEKIKHPSLKVLVRLAEALNVNVAVFFEEDSSNVVPLKPLEVSTLLKNLSHIPDEVYDLAFKLGNAGAEEWEGVKGILDEAIEHKKTKNNGSKNHA